MKDKALFLSILCVFLAGPALAAEPVSLNQPQAPVAADRPVLTATAIASPAAISSGQTTILTVKIENTGTADAKKLQVSYDIPAGLVLVPATTSNQWSLSNLSAGRATTFTIKLSATTAVGRYPNEITVSAAGADSVLALAPLDVTAPRVLGASDSTLAATGNTTRDLFFPLAGSLMIISGWLLLRRLPTN